MKIAFLMEKVSRDCGGIFSALVSISKELSKNKDIEIRVFGAESKNSIQDLPEWKNLVVKSFKVIGPKKFRYLSGLKEELAEFNPDIIHNNGIWTYNSIVATQMKKPYVISPHGMLDKWALKNSYWKKLIAKFFYVNKHLKNATCIHALHKEELKSVREYGLKNPAFIIPYMIDTKVQKPIILPLWKKLKKDKKNILLFFSRIDKKKGLEILFKGLKMLDSKTAKDWMLIISGKGEDCYEKNIKDLVRKLKLQEKIIFTGEIPPKEKNSAMYYSDALILPSYSEGMPLAVLEAFANKLPVIMTKECNLTESFSNGATIEISTNPQSISVGLKTLFSMSKQQRKFMGKKGFLFVKKRFNSKDISEKILKMYEFAIRRFHKDKY